MNNRDKLMKRFCRWLLAVNHALQLRIIDAALREAERRGITDDVCESLVPSAISAKMTRLQKLRFGTIIFGGLQGRINMAQRGLTASQVSSILGINRDTFYDWLKRGTISKSGLGFLGTNARNGRYNLEKVLDFAIRAAEFDLDKKVRCDLPKKLRLARGHAKRLALWQRPSIR